MNSLEMYADRVHHHLVLFLHVAYAIVKIRMLSTLLSNAPRYTPLGLIFEKFGLFLVRICLLILDQSGCSFLLEILNIDHRAKVLFMLQRSWPLRNDLIFGEGKAPVLDLSPLSKFMWLVSWMW